MESIIAALRDYFAQCPLLQAHCLNVDYLPERPDATGLEFSLDASPGRTLAKQYATGALYQYPFVVRSVNHYGSDQLQNMANSGLLEQLGQWLRQESAEGRLPQLPEGMSALRVEATGSAYLMNAGPSTGKYQIQCMLEYYQEGMKHDG